MAVPAAGLIRLAAPEHDDGSVPPRRFPFDQPWIARRRPATDHADRLELVDHLRDAHECGHGPEREATEIDVGAGKNDADSTVGEAVGDVHNALVQEL